MTDASREIPLRMLRLAPGMPESFADLLRIYHDAIPQGERKSDAALAVMLRRADYEFRVSLAGDAVTGFTIVKFLTAEDACLLEYMAVDRSLRGQGIGSALFQAACGSAKATSRFVLVEVDSDAEAAADREIRTRRKAFYRALGCREVAGLSYLMPLVGRQPPPEMDLLVYRSSLPATLAKSRLRRWLGCVYSEVYQEPSDDGRIARMLSAMPDHIELR